MRAILICPDERPALAHLAGVAPLANLPILGQGLAEYWLEHLAVLGAKEVLVLAADRPHEVRARVERGAHRFVAGDGPFVLLRELTRQLE